MSNKKTLILKMLIGVTFIIFGAAGLLLILPLVLDKSYMATQRALGEPGAVSRMWLFFAASAAAALLGLLLLVRSFRNMRKTNE